MPITDEDILKEIHADEIEAVRRRETTKELQAARRKEAEEREAAKQKEAKRRLAISRYWVEDEPVTFDVYRAWMDFRVHFSATYLANVVGNREAWEAWKKAWKVGDFPNQPGKGKRLLGKPGPWK